MGEWTLFSNHGHVLVCLARNNQARLRDVAADVGITERAVQNILRELQDAGLVAISKHGRCNHYQINSRKSLRHPLESGCTVGKLMQLINQDEPSAAQAEPEVQKPKPAKPGISKTSRAETVSTPAAGPAIPDNPKEATVQDSPRVVTTPVTRKVVSETSSPSHVVAQKVVAEEKTPAMAASPSKPDVGVVENKKPPAEVKPEKLDVASSQSASKEKAGEELRADASNSADKKPEASKSEAKKSKDKPPSSQQGSLF